MKTTDHRSLFLLLLLFISGLVEAQDWTRFRGPNGSGISDAKTIPTQWTEKNINWKVTLPGPGHSSPVLWGEKVFVTCADEKAGGIIVLCLNANDGKILWQHRSDFEVFPVHRNNNFASSTPAVDAGRLYVYYTTPAQCTLMAFDHEGKGVWKRDLGAFTGKHGGGSSPIAYQDMVVFASDQDSGGESFVIAVDAKTGETRWKTPRRSALACYSTPCVFESPGQRAALIFNNRAHGMAALDPQDGRVLWELNDTFDTRTVSSPVVGSGLIFGSCGSEGRVTYVAAVRPGDPANGGKPDVAYQFRKSASHCPTGVAVGNRLFLWSDGGIVTCLDAPTGDVRWQERVGGNYFASPVCVDGRLFGISTSGEVVVVAVSDKFQELARFPFGEPTHATPAVAGGRMYIRTVGHLFSVGGKPRELSAN